MQGHDAVTIIKEMNYRGATEEWSNTYLLNGTTPTDEAGWKTLFDAIAATEKTCYSNASKIIRAYGYTDASDLAVASHDYKAAGTSINGAFLLNGSLEQNWAGDQAAWVRMKCGTNVKGKPKYLRKYFHSGASPTGQPDIVAPNLKAAYVAHAVKMTDGTLPGQMKWIGPGEVVGTAPAASSYTTTRTLKRRGRRPS